jgi:hypothetical protein
MMTWPDGLPYQGSLLTSVDTSRRIASRSTSSANAPVFGDVLVRLADVQQRAAQSVGMGGALACRSHVRGVFMGCLEVVDNAVRRPRDAALIRMRAKVSTCSLTVRKLAALFGVPAQGPSSAERDVAHGVLQARVCGYGYVSALLDVGSAVPD